MSSAKNKVPLRTLQYIGILRLASKLTGFNLLNGCGKMALDVGCGSGKRLLALSLLGYDVYGFDVSAEAVREAYKLGFQRKVLQWDVEESIPFNEEFDLVTCFSVLEHLYHPQRALTNILAIKPKILLIDVPNRHTEFLRLIYLILKGEKITITLSRGDGFLLKDADHVNVKTTSQWLRLIHTTLYKFPEMRVLTSTNYVMPFPHITFTLPYLGSSMLIIIGRK